MNFNTSADTSAKGAVGSVFGMVSSAASSIASIFTTAEHGVQQLNRYVRVASEKQALTYDYDMATFEESLLETASISEAKRKEEILGYMAQTPAHKELFDNAFARIQSAVHLRRNPGSQPAIA